MKKLAILGLSLMLTSMTAFAALAAGTVHWTIRGKKGRNTGAL
jgi:hypothetical protein